MSEKKNSTAGYKKTASETEDRKDVYTRVTERIIADLEKGVRPWMKPWQAEHPAGSITRPLRHNGIPYRGMNVLLLWSEAMEKGYSAPLWMTYKQAQELGANVRKGEKGSLVVYANSISKTETNDKGEDVEREIPFMKGYTVFNVEQVEGLAAHYYAAPVNPLALSERIESADAYRRRQAQPFITAATGRFILPPVTSFRCRSFKPSRTRKAITRPLFMN